MSAGVAWHTATAMPGWQTAAAAGVSKPLQRSKALWNMRFGRARCGQFFLCVDIAHRQAVQQRNRHVVSPPQATVRGAQTRHPLVQTRQFPRRSDAVSRYCSSGSIAVWKLCLKGRGQSGHKSCLPGLRGEMHQASGTCARAADLGDNRSLSHFMIANAQQH